MSQSSSSSAKGDNGKSFEFITSSGPPGQLLADRTAVRKIKSHVMRRYQSQKRTTNGDESKNKRLQETERLLQRLRMYQQSGHHREFSRGYVDVAQGPYVAQLLSQTSASGIYSNHPRLASLVIGGSSPDPFNTLPIIKSDKTNLLLSHINIGLGFESKFQVTSVPNEDWLQMLSSDFLTMQACLCLTAYHLRNAEGIETEFYRLKVETVRSINEELSRNNLSDGLFAAVALIGAREGPMRILSGGPNVHLDALKIMVQSRGGLQALGMRGLLARSLYWIDRFDSWLHLSPPRFPAIICTENRTRARNVGVVVDVDLSPEYPIQPSPEVGMIEITHVLRTLSEENETLPWKQENYDDRMHFSDRITCLEGQLIDLICGPAGSEPVFEMQHSLPAIEQCFFIAARLYISHFLRQLGSHWFMFGPNLARMRENIMLFEREPDFQGLQRLSEGQAASTFLWILFQGGVSAYGGPEGPWYMSKISKVCATFELEVWEDVYECLKAVSCCERCCLSPWKKVWLEANQPQGYQQLTDDWKKKMFLISSDELEGC